MQKIIYPEQSKVSVEPLEELPPPASGELQIKTLHSCISPGTELAWLHKKPGVRISYPCRAGYANCGQIVAIGDNVEGFEVGQKVVTTGNHVAMYNLAASVCHLLPDSVDSLEASMHTMVSISLQGVRKTECQIGHSVAILGLGIIGNLAGQLARENGSTCVVGIDPVAHRRDVAKQCGFDHVCESWDQAMDLPLPPRVKAAGGFDAVIEATGIADPIKQSFKLVRDWGKVILLGSTRGLADGVDFYEDIHRKGISVIGAHTRTRGQAEQRGPFFTLESDNKICVELLAANRIKTRPLISDVVKPEDAPSAYQRLTEREEGVITIAYDWSE